MKEGRTYSRDFGADKSSIIFNEAAIESMGIANPIGKTVKVWGEDKQIIGVTKNFHFESLYENIKPCFFDLSLNHRASRIMVRIQAGTEQSTIERLENLYRRHAGEIFQYKFLDDDYQALYVAEQRVAILSRYFAAIALVVSCLGLFGLAAFTAQKRQKEIGIRKVIGASVSRLVVLLIKEFLFLLLIALLIAIPTSWWIEISWLQNFAYRIKIQPLVFVISGACVIIVTLLTISFQSIKAAAANPAKTLRSE